MEDPFVNALFLFLKTKVLHNKCFITNFDHSYWYFIITISFVDIKSSHNLQDIIISNIQRRNSRLGVKFKGTGKKLSLFVGVQKI